MAWDLFFLKGLRLKPAQKCDKLFAQFFRKDEFIHTKHRENFYHYDKN